MSNPFAQDAANAGSEAQQDRFANAEDAQFTEVGGESSQGANNQQQAEGQATGNQQQAESAATNTKPAETEEEMKARLRAELMAENAQQQQSAQTQNTAQQSTAVAQPNQQSTGTAVGAPVNNSIGLGAIAEVDFDTEIDLGQLERFPKLAKNETARIAFVLFTAKGMPSFKMVQVFWIEELKKSFVAPQNPDLLAECVKLLGEPKIRFGTVIVKYNTDKEGQVLSPKVEHLALTFATDKWPLFKQIGKEWPLANHDVSILCTETEFQKWTPSACSQCYVKANAAFYAEVQKKAQSLYDNRLDRRLGLVMEDNEIRTILNQFRNLKKQGGQFQGSNPFENGGANAGGNQGGAAGGNPFAAGNAGGGEDFSNLLASQSQQ